MGGKGIRKMRTISVTPAGRRRYLEILVPYLLRNRAWLNEHHFWVNTTAEEDLEYLEGLAQQHPDFFKLIKRPLDYSQLVGHRIWQFTKDYVDPDTMYVRFDDDICYMADDAVEKLCRFRLEHPEPFLVLGNIVNNAVCAHYHQRAGLVPLSWGEVQNECMDDVGWGRGSFARRLHTKFLADLRKGNQEAWKQTPFSHNGLKRFSINTICWFGRDMAQVPELYEDEIEEEEFLTETLPARFGRPTAICREALFGHFAFYTQRPYLEYTSSSLLDEYRELSQRGGDPSGSRSSLTVWRGSLERQARDKVWKLTRPWRDRNRHLPGAA